MFGGQLQSDHTCDKCGSVSSKVDPILDVSLQLDGGGAEENTLAGCLRRYVRLVSQSLRYLRSDQVYTARDDGEIQL